MEAITIQDDEVRAVSPEGTTSSMKLTELLSKLAPRRPDSAEMVLPDGVKALIPMATGAIVVHQTPPRVFSFKWIAADSEAEFGGGTRYRTVRIALPYLVVLAVFESPRGGLPTLGARNECFFLNQPLDANGYDTELHFPALLNCSRFPDDPNHPLSWICTQHLRPRDFLVKSNLERSIHVGLSALLRHLLESGFNRSSEQHELNSWYSESVAAGIDPRIASVEDWEKATAEDPLFVLEVPWLSTGRSLREVTLRIIGAGGSAQTPPTNANDLARIIHNQNPPKRTRRSE